MNTSHNTLVLRKQSIRTLTADELRIAHGGTGTGETRQTMLFSFHTSGFHTFTRKTF